MAEQQSGAVTFLFTDVEGSTRLWEEHPDAMREVLAWHDSVLAESVSAHRGRVVKSTGDGVHAVFSHAGDAVIAAVEAQRKFTSTRWDAIGTLRVRMGLHSGPAQERAGDYFGPAVNRAARVAAAAHGAQILLSARAVELARASLPNDVSLVELGDFELRDLAVPERLAMACVAGLPATFPPPRSLRSYTGNLRPQLSSFVGREEVVVTVAAALANARLITLTGEGGVGKSRLSAQVAADVLSRFPGGAWICELASAADGEHVIDIVAASLGIARQASTTLERSVLDALSDRQALLLLDNCEHVIDEACNVAELILAYCPRVCVLATSREALHVDGERVVRVEPLSLPSEEGDPRSAASVELFVDRARSVRSDLDFDGEQLRAVVEICHRLDGLPLAIELAAGAVVAATPVEVAQRLDERFRLLRTTRRGGAAHHQTLRSVVDWSYSTLSSDEQHVYARLGVFRGTFDEAAAVAVAADVALDQWAVRDALSGLVTKSMVRALGVSGRTRYELLETLRVYALGLLDDGSVDAARLAHARHYAATATLAAPKLWTADELLVQTHIAADLDNLRAAVEWSLAQSEPARRRPALEIVDALAVETMFQPALGVGDWAERALVLSDDELVGREGVPFAAAFSRMWRGEIADGAALAAELLARLEEPADVRRACGLNIIAIEHLMEGDIEFGRAQFREASAKLEASSGDHAQQEIAEWAYSMWSSLWASFAGDQSEARWFAERTLRVARTANNPSMLTAALFVFAQSIAEDDPDEALRCLDEGASLTESGAAAPVYAVTLGLSAALLARRGDPIAALRRLHAGLAYLHRDFGIAMSADVFDGIARSCTELGESELGATILGARLAGAVAGHHGRLSGLDAEAFTDVLRRRMDPARFDAAYRRGAALSVDELVVFALDGVERILAEHAPAIM